MANGAKIAKNMLNFAAGMNASLRPVANQVGMEALGKNGQKAAKQILESSAGRMGTKVGNAVMNNTMTTGITRTIHNMDGGMQFKQALRQAHTGANGQISKRKVAGTMATVGIAGRVATGGGLYRDRYGNVNIPGVPFI